LNPSFGSGIVRHMSPRM